MFEYSLVSLLGYDLILCAKATLSSNKKKQGFPVFYDIDYKDPQPSYLHNTKVI